MFLFTMIERHISEKDAGQRLDKYLRRTLPSAGSGFLYRMLRKKNITLNGKRAQGGEILSADDSVAFFFSDETFRKFSAPDPEDGEKAVLSARLRHAEEAWNRKLLSEKAVLFENEHVLLLNKPAGVLSQSAGPNGKGPDREKYPAYSVNDWLWGYLLYHRGVDRDMLLREMPSVCNRLDRNTSGILAASADSAGSRILTGLIRENRLRKTYRLIVSGEIPESGVIEGYLRKDPSENKVVFTEKEAEGAAYSRTEYRRIKTGNGLSLAEADLITGRTHQLRAHFAAIGHPILFDGKYGDSSLNRSFAGKLQGSLSHRPYALHCARLAFPEMTGLIRDLSGRTVTAPDPDFFRSLVLMMEE